MYRRSVLTSARPALSLKTGALSVLAALGCHDTNPAVAPARCESTLQCIADPEPRELPSDCCVDGRDCQAGLVCESRAATDDDPRPGTCRPMPDDASLFFEVLTDGFGVPSLPLAQQNPADTVAAFTWLAPPGTLNVHCALFGCPPRIVDGQLIDFDRCVIRSEGFVGGQGMFSPAGGAGPSLTASTCDAASDAILPPAISTLLVGCWAYGATTIVAASSLQEIAPAQVGAGSIPGFVDACSDASDAATCTFMSAPQVLGTCAAGACRHRCVDDADCMSAAVPAPDDGTGTGDGSTGATDALDDGTGTDDGSTGATDALTCDRRFHALGVCMPGMAGR